MAWDYPFFIIAMFLGAMGIVVWMMRSAAGPRKPAFECDVCGRKRVPGDATDWRYCPWCGVPRESKSLRDLPPKRSVLDIE